MTLASEVFVVSAVFLFGLFLFGVGWGAGRPANEPTGRGFSVGAWLFAAGLAAFVASGGVLIVGRLAALLGKEGP